MCHGGNDKNCVRLVNLFAVPGTDADPRGQGRRQLPLRRRQSMELGQVGDGPSRPRRNAQAQRRSDGAPVSALAGAQRHAWDGSRLNVETAASGAATLNA